MSNPTDENQNITLEDISHAEKLIGLEFTDAERQQMLNGINAQVNDYERIRHIPLENSVSPAFRFNPILASNTYHSATTRPIHIHDAVEVERPANLEDVAFWPVTQLSKLIETRQVTSVELTEMYLDRLKYYNKWLECVVTFTDDLAMEQAQEADEEISRGHYRGPLHGIPWGAKDLLAVEGYKTTWGAMPYKDQTIATRASVVRRLEEAGAVLIAKLTLGALAYGDIWFGGKTKNPWDITEGSSGSSAGSGAATAAGLVGFAIGTETYGSIVSPATRNGVTGLRPTFGRVSRYGAMALCWTLDKIGPLCRSVEDCALVFNAIYGPDGLDEHVIDAPFAWQPDMPLRDLRIGYLKQAFDEEREQKSIDDGVLAVLKNLGVELIPIELPAIDIESLGIILSVEAAAAFDEITRNNQDDMMQWQDDSAWPNTFRQARLIPAVEYIQANRIRTLLMQQMNQLMQSIDVFVTPSFGGNSLFVTNLTGHPALVLPDGFNAKGSPTSIVFIGGLFEENKVLCVANAYQNATDFHKQHPSMQYAD